MAYVLNTPDDQKQMLRAIGLESMDQLFAAIPDELRLDGSLDLPPALSELELTTHLEELAKQNASCADRTCFLGGGSYDTISFRRSSTRSLREVSSTRPTPLISPRRAKGACRRSLNTRPSFAS